MKKHYLLFILFFSSCHKKSLDSASMFSKSGDLKDKIAFVKMIDASGLEHKWDICQELSSYIEKDIARKDTLYVIPCDEQVSLSFQKNPFSEDLIWLHDYFSHVDYVAFTELLKYQQTPLIQGIKHNLEIALRVRVFAKTNDTFKPVLQEIITQKYLVPTLVTQTINLQPTYPSQGYDLSAVGITHHNFASLVAKRIRDYTKNNPL